MKATPRVLRDILPQATPGATVHPSSKHLEQQVRDIDDIRRHLESALYECQALAYVIKHFAFEFSTAADDPAKAAVQVVANILHDRIGEALETQGQAVTHAAS